MQGLDSIEGLTDDGDVLALVSGHDLREETNSRERRHRDFREDEIESVALLLHDLPRFEPVRHRRNCPRCPHPTLGGNSNSKREKERSEGGK